MSGYAVYFATEASQSIDIEHNGEFDPEAIADAAAEELDTTLCHQCSKVELGDFMAIIITDASGSEVWTAQNESRVFAARELERMAELIGGESAEALRKRAKQLLDLS